MVNCRNLSPREIQERLWWLLRSSGSRATGWGNNVDRHVSRRRSVQGGWTPATAALMQDVPFAVREL